MPPRGLSGPSCRLMAASWDQVPACLPPGSFDKPSSSRTISCFSSTHASCSPPRRVRSCLTVASLGRGPPSRQPVGAQLVSLVASPGPAPVCGWPLQAQTLPHSGTTPGLPLSLPCAPRAKLLPFRASAGPAPASQWPSPVFDFLWTPQAQNLISSWPLRSQPPASQRPVHRPSLCLTAGPPMSRPQPHCGLPSLTLLPSGSYNSPGLCLPMASTSPAHHLQWPFRAQFVPFW